MRDKFRHNPANSDRFHADYCCIGTVSAASSSLRNRRVGPEGRDATRVLTTQLRDGDGVHRGE